MSTKANNSIPTNREVGILHMKTDANPVNPSELAEFIKNIVKHFNPNTNKEYAGVGYEEQFKNMMCDTVILEGSTSFDFRSSIIIFKGVAGPTPDMDIEMPIILKLNHYWTERMKYNDIADNYKDAWVNGEIAIVDLYYSTIGSNSTMTARAGNTCIISYDPNFNLPTLFFYPLDVAGGPTAILKSNPMNIY